MLCVAVEPYNKLAHANSKLKTYYHNISNCLEKKREERIVWQRDCARGIGYFISHACSHVSMFLLDVNPVGNLPNKPTLPNFHPTSNWLQTASHKTWICESKHQLNSLFVVSSCALVCEFSCSPSSSINSWNHWPQMVPYIEGFLAGWFSCRVGKSKLKHEHILIIFISLYTNSTAC